MAIKLQLTEVLELLALAGVQAVEIVDKAEDSDYATSAKGDSPITSDTLLMAIDANRETIIAPKVISAKTGEIHSAMAGKINGVLRSQLSQKTGIPTSELKDLESKEAIEKAFSFLIEKIGGDKTTLIAERDELIAKHSQAMSAKEKENESKINEVMGRLTEKEIIAKLVKEHNEAKGLPIGSNRANLAKMFKSYLDSEAIVKYDESKDEIQLFDKKNPDIRLYKNDSKTAYLTPSDKMKPYYTDLGMWNEDTRNVNAADAMKDKTNNVYVPKANSDGRVQSPIDAINEATMAYANAATGAGV